MVHLARRFAFPAVVILLTALLVSALRAEPRQEPVISLDYRGDRLERLTEQPLLSVYGGGAVAVAKVRAHDEALSMKITQAELDELLRFIRSQGFFDPSTPTHTASPDSSLESHPATTVVTVRDGQTRSRSVVDLRHAPDQEGFRAIVARLERLLDMARLGGVQAASEWLLRANAELAAVHPDLPALSLADLASGTRRADGSMSVVFARPDDDVKVSMAIDSTGHYGVSVFPRR